MRKTFNQKHTLAKYVKTDTNTRPKHTARCTKVMFLTPVLKGAIELPSNTCVICYYLVSLNLRRHAHGTLAKRWCIWHTFLETLQECRSRHLTGWIKPDFWETQESRLFSVCRETKMPWRQTPSQKKKAVVFTNVTTNAYQGQLNAGFS